MIHRTLTLGLLAAGLAPATLHAALLYGLTSSNALISFDSSAPAEITTIGDISTPGLVDIDFYPVNGLLYELWRSGFLDSELARLDLASRFNQHPIVQTYLTLRLSPLLLALPPVVAPAPPASLRLGLVAAVAIADGATVTPATALGQVELGFAPGDRIATEVALRGLDVTCAPTPGVLTPCYGDVVAAIRDGSTDSHAALGAALSTVLTELFVGRRLAADAAPAELAIDAARAQTIVSATAVRLELDAHLAPASP